MVSFLSISQKKCILVPVAMYTINTTSPDYVLHLSGCFKHKNTKFTQITCALLSV